MSVVCSHGPQIGQFSCPSCRFEEDQRRRDRQRRAQWQAEQNAAAQARAQQQEAARREAQAAETARTKAAELEAARRSEAIGELEAKRRETERLLREGRSGTSRPTPQKILTPTPPPARTAASPARNRAAVKGVVAVALGLAAVGAAAAYFLSKSKRGSPGERPPNPLPPQPVPPPKGAQPRPDIEDLQGWQRVGSRGQLGPLTCSPDGSFSYGGMTFDQASSMRRCSFGDLTVDKAPGEGQVLTVSAAGTRHHLRYVAGSWYHRSEPA